MPLNGNVKKEQMGSVMHPFSFISVMLTGLTILTAGGASADQTEVIDRLKFGGEME